MKSKSVSSSISISEVHFYALLSFVEFILVYLAVGQHFEVAHSVVHSFEEVLEVGDPHVLVYGKIVHALSEPVHIDNVVFEDVEVKGAVKIAIVLKNLDVDVPDEVRSYDDDGDDQEKVMCHFPRALLH